MAVHHLAAKALMDDYETGKSWLHTLNPALKDTNPAAFDKILERQAQQLGQKWSITGKWTSYVAIDHSSAQDHDISLQKAETIEISQLNRPRHTPNFSSRFLAEPRRGLRSFSIPIQGSTQGSFSSHPSENYDSLSFAMGLAAQFSSTCERNGRMQEIDGPMFYGSSYGAYAGEGLSKQSTEAQSNMRTQGPIPFHLYGILYTQTADGRFHLDDSMLSDALRQEYGKLALEQSLAFLSEKNPIIRTDPEFEILCRNILVVVYITYHHRASRSLWELQVAKARQWIKQKMVELLKKSGMQEPPEISLEELEETIIKVLDKNMQEA